MDIELFWTVSNDTIKKQFNVNIRSIYRDFKFKYSWDGLPQVENYLMRLIFSTYFSNEGVRGELPNLIHDIEVFFAAGFSTGLFNFDNIDNIISNLKNRETGLRVIEFLPPELSHVYGYSIGNKVYINQRMTSHFNSPQLTSLEVRRMYIFHEIGHKILKVLPTLNLYNNYISTLEPILEEKGLQNYDLSLKEYVVDGFTMIEECLTQELAEYLTYYSSQKQRPQFQNRNDLGCVVLTNHDYYGIFQTPTINLGKTIRGCLKNCSTNEDILLYMIKKALNSNFSQELIFEYYHGNANLYYDLFLILRTMGMLKCKKYASFGVANNIGVNSKQCLELIDVLTKRNRDWRDYPIGGYNPIDFEFYKRIKS